jgi:hypothetical protein
MRTHGVGQAARVEMQRTNGLQSSPFLLFQKKELIWIALFHISLYLGGMLGRESSTSAT